MRATIIILIIMALAQQSDDAIMQRGITKSAEDRNQEFERHCSRAGNRDTSVGRLRTALPEMLHHDGAERKTTGVSHHRKTKRQSNLNAEGFAREPKVWLE